MDPKKILKEISAGVERDAYEEALKGYAVRRKWMTAAWLLGASYRQLALLHGITKATILQSVDKEMSKDDRASARLGGKLSYSALEWYYHAFVSNAKLLATFSPPAAAEWLLSHQPYTSD